MKIVLLAHGLSAAGGKSVGMNIIEAAARIRPNHHYLIFVPSGVGYEDINFPQHSEIFFFNPRRGKIYRCYFDLYLLTSKIKAFSPDIIWGLGNIGITNHNSFQAILFHKPQLVYPLENNPHELFRKKINNWFIKYQLQRCIPETNLVFCQTKVMRQRFKDTFCYRNEIAICPNAISAQINTPSNITPPDVINNNKDKFILFILTRFYAHKNLELIVETFRKYRKDLHNIVCIFTVEPADHPNCPSFLKKISDFELEENLINVGPISQNELGNYYCNSQALLLPTLLESFSGTYIEAMRFNCPIITSDLDFSREICGNAAQYFNPWSPNSLKDAILQLQADPKLQQQLREHGQHQLSIKTDSWKDITNKAFNKIEQLYLNSK